MIDTKNMQEVNLKCKRLELIIDDIKDINRFLDRITEFTEDRDIISKAKEAQTALKISQKSVAEAWVFFELIHKNLENICKAEKDEVCTI